MWVYLLSCHLKCERLSLSLSFWGEVLHSSNYLGGSLDSLQQVHVLPVLRTRWGLTGMRSWNHVHRSTNCIGWELNPNLLLGRWEFYHRTTDAGDFFFGSFCTLPLLKKMELKKTFYLTNTQAPPTSLIFPFCTSTEEFCFHNWEFLGQLPLA